MKFFSSLLGAFFLVLQSSAQSPLPFEIPFLQNEVTSIYITIAPDSLAIMYQDVNYGATHEFPADFQFHSSQGVVTLSNVGLRLRGNTSLNAAKKSFRISLDSFQDTSLWGLEEINLIGQHNDPSLIRSKLCHDLFRSMQVPCARTSFTKLYINGNYAGLYLNQEHLDERWIKKYFGENEGGNLYKCTYPADLDFISNDPEDYSSPEAWGTRKYDLKTNNWREDYRDLAQFIAALTNLPASSLPCSLDKYLNIDAYLRAAAVDVLTGNWDGYIYNKNNFYLYHSDATDQFWFIPYDLDNTLGIDWVGQNWTTRNIYSWAPSSQNRPLFKRLLQSAVLRNRFSHYINDLCSGAFAPGTFQVQADYWHSLIAESVMEDTFYTLDYGFSFLDFEESLQEAWGQQVAFGILPYNQARIQTALDQLENLTSLGQVAGSISAMSPVYITDTVFDAQLWASAPTQWQFFSGWSTSPTSATSFDASGFAQQELTFQSSDKYYYRAQAGNNVYPCDVQFSWASKAPEPLYINEVMTQNTNTIADEVGEYADWCELWNGGSTAIALDGFYLTDSDRTNADRWPLPQVTLQPGAHLLVWLDDDPEQGLLHANFSLNNSETLHLFKKDQGRMRLVDSLSFQGIVQNSSLQRMPDGGENWAVAAPTPGTWNNSNNVFTWDAPTWQAFPNPIVSGRVLFSKRCTLLNVYNERGSLVATYSNVTELDTSAWSSGLYLMKSEHGSIRMMVMAQ